MNAKDQKWNENRLTVARPKEPELTTYWSGTVGGVTNTQRKQSRVLRCKSYSKTQANPVESVCRSRHWAVKNTKNTS